MKLETHRISSPSSTWFGIGIGVGDSVGWWPLVILIPYTCNLTVSHHLEEKKSK